MFIDYNCQQKSWIVFFLLFSKSIAVWLQFVFGFLLFGRRFLPLTPPFFKCQFFYDRVWKSITSVKIRNWIDWQTCRQIFYQEDYQLNHLARNQDIVNFYEKIISSNKIPLIVDCGANIGLAAHYFSITYGGSQILAIEPDENNFFQGQSNAKLGVTHLFNAVGSENGKVELVDPNLGNSGYRVQTNINGSINLISINEILLLYPVEQFVPFIIKIDIEGFEANLFSINTEWLSKFPVVIIELHDWMLPGTANSNNFLKEISRLNNDFILKGENVISISNSLMN